MTGIIDATGGAARGIYIITGERGVGKTTLCQRVVEEACRRGWQARGVISPARMEGNGNNLYKIGIDLLDLSSGERFQLAQRIPDDAGSNTGKNGEVMTKRWAFDPQVLALGSRILAKSVPCDLLVVDELGPLEFERGEGWVEGLAALDSGLYRVALVVIRPELLEVARSRWHSAQVIFASRDTTFRCDDL
jgi:nucleoside-triphosphatase THEP1